MRSAETFYLSDRNSGLALTKARWCWLTDWLAEGWQAGPIV